MFTGIIKEVGNVQQKQMLGSAARFCFFAPHTVQESERGDSICVNGICLTASHLTKDCFWADLSEETLKRSSMSKILVNDEVNIEPSLRPSDRLGGHIVSGHVDAVGYINELTKTENFFTLKFSFPNTLAPLIAEKGSIALDGISLTIANVNEQQAGVALIPHTVEQTNLRNKKVGEAINIEVDMLARYVQRLLSFEQDEPNTGLTAVKLQQYGYY